MSLVGSILGLTGVVVERVQHQRDAAPAAYAAGPVSLQSGARAGQHAQVMAGADCADVAFLHIERHYRVVPY